MKKIFTTVFCAVLAAVLPLSVFAAEPEQAGIGLQPAATPNKERLIAFHDDLLMWIITGIVLFVFALLVWVAIRYNAKANPIPSKTTHNVPLEIVWTLIPVLILVVIAFPSYKLLFYLDRTDAPDMTLKVTGYQWGWTYTYPDHENLEFNADMIPDDELNTYIPDGKGRRLLETYNPIVVPIDKNIQVLMTANDVLHSWTVPAFGVKKDAVPGRMNETWFRVTKPGVYYGQCSEICGIRHAFMPIAVYAVEQQEYDSWIACMKGDGAEAKADYPARACVQTLGFDKYRSNQRSNNVADATGAR